MSLAATREYPESYIVESCLELDTGWDHQPDVDSYLRFTKGTDEVHVHERERREYPLTDALQEIQSSEFQERLSHIRPGREEDVFTSELTISRLIRGLRGSPAADRKIEAALDLLFEALRRDEDFEHTETVMTLLYALKQAQRPLFERVAKVLAESRAAELARLSRYARRLLAE